MTSILIVDDSTIERQMAGRLIGAQSHWKTQFAADGVEALRKLEAESFDLIVSDLQMPNMTGLELLAEVRSRFPSIPLIVMTSRGSEELAVEALQNGAAGYLPKRNLAGHLVEMVEQVLTASQRARRHDTVMSSMVAQDVTFELENDTALTAIVISYLQDCAVQLGVCDDNDRTRIGIALEEALVNAMIHGNLEVGSELRGVDDEAYRQLLAARRATPMYRDRRVHVQARMDRDRVEFLIRDEGPGFDCQALPDPTDPENLLKASGRGVLMMRAFMNEVEYNEAGNAVTLTKYAVSHATVE